MPKIQALIFDWGDTLMRNFDFPGAMAFWPRVEVIPGVEKSLDILSGRYTCCVASNAGDSDAHLMGEGLERGQIRKYFVKLWTSRELGAVKPEPEFFQAILNNLCLPPEVCVMIGDDYKKDICPAKKAGLGTIHLAGPTVDYEPMADAIIRSMEDLVDAVCKLDIVPCSKESIS